MESKYSDEQILKLMFENEKEIKENLSDIYNSFLLKQYEIYMDIAEKQGSRRDIQNNFFLSIHALILAGIGFCLNYMPSEVVFIILVASLGLCITWSWHKFIISSKTIRDVVYRLIRVFESRMPVKGFGTENLLLNEEKQSKFYKPFTKIEENIPIFFAIAYSGVVFYMLYKHSISIF